MQIQRLFEITYILLQKKRVTAKELAQHFEVSTRTIYRDLDLLSMSGIPLYTNKGNNGGIFLMDGYTLSKSLLSDEEQQHMIAALQSYHIAEREEVSTLLTKLSAQFQKEQINWIDVDFSEWGSQHTGITFQVIKDAILQKKVLQFNYHNSYGQSKLRKVEPFRLMFKSQSWYLIAYCLEKQDQRMFKLNRMEDIQTLTQDILHELDESIIEAIYHYDKHDLVQIIAHVNSSLAYRVYDEYTAYNYTKQEDGSILLHIGFPPGEWIYSYLMSFGPDLKVIEPQYIKDELINRYRKALQNYEVSS